ncbi:DUF4244 domain-containing protein [Streptomyces marianii]|uniref:DUF4244 domain-containing protein n=1 Tax=Streptomyces marianii TaxID=1817406 RepID=A0A5R9E6N9_9ACTN|nr:DUF4244 domain-containing protein [Streptomyces marianii]TLQ44559.1 DUF4244 domain-containing protein [Streptomyces marianii]
MSVTDVKTQGAVLTGVGSANFARTRAASRASEILTRARDRLSGRLPRGDAGMTTSEYAMGTIAACAFAAALYQVITSDTVSTALESIIGKALNGQF